MRWPVQDSASRKGLTGSQLPPREDVNERRRCLCSLIVAKWPWRSGDGACDPRCRSARGRTRTRGCPHKSGPTRQSQQAQVLALSIPPEANMRCVWDLSEGGLAWPSWDRWRTASCKAGAPRCGVGPWERQMLVAVDSGAKGWVVPGLCKERVWLTGYAMPPQQPARKVRTSRAGRYEHA